MRLIFWSTCIGTIGLLIGVIKFFIWFYTKIDMLDFIALLCVMFMFLMLLIYALKDIYKLDF